jgi:hypothetical protein
MENTMVYTPLLLLITAHPYLDAVALVAGAFMIERVFLILCGSIAVLLHGPYRGQALGWVERAGIFTVALILMASPLFILASL